MSTHDSSQELLLLDTHVWIWLMNGDESLRDSGVVPGIEEAAEVGAVHVLSLSVWEVGMLVAKGRLDLGCDPAVWIERALRAPGISMLPLSVDAALESSRLPGTFHADPVDRMLVATARTMNAALVTRDRAILRYAHSKHVKALKA